jgi:micrococcal nuclease
MIVLAAWTCATFPPRAMLTAIAGPVDVVVLAVIDGRAVGVVDGDSIAVDGQEWRLVGFDAPETERAKCEAERRLGLLAKRRLEQILRGSGPFALVDSGHRDRHKRPLGSLMVAGIDVASTLVSEDLARPYAGGIKRGWCTRDSRDDLIPGPRPSREMSRPPKGQLPPTG